MTTSWQEINRAALTNALFVAKEPRGELCAAYAPASEFIMAVRMM